MDGETFLILKKGVMYMKFPNAAKGFKKIFTAEILNLISFLCLIIAALVLAGSIGVAVNLNSVNAGKATFIGGAVGAVLLIVAFFVLHIVAFIMNLVGYINARHDDNNFATALVFLILSIVFAAISGILYKNGAGSVLFSLSTLSNTIATIFVIAGGVKIADQLNRGDVSRKGSLVLKLIIAIELLSFTASMITTFMGGMTAGVTALVLLVVSLVLIIVKYITYLVFLSKAKNMLAENGSVIR